jgi:type IV secretion system protein VirB10
MTADPSRIDAGTGFTEPHGIDRNAVSHESDEMGLPDVAAPQRQPISKKALLAVALLILSLVFASALAIQRLTAKAAASHKDDDKMVRDKPAAATAEPRRLDLGAAITGAASSSSTSAPRIPALVPTEEERAEPIGVRRTGSSSSSAPGITPLMPEDAPVLLVSTRPGQGPTTGTASPVIETRESVDTGEAVTGPHDPHDSLGATSRNLEGYQRQLQGLLENLTRTADLARTGSTLPEPTGLPTPGGNGSLSQAGLFGGQLLGSATPKATATILGNRSLTLPKGTTFTCALKSRVVTASSGMVGCMVQRNVYGDNGRVLLIERGSHLDGEYRVTTVRPGMVRIPVLWTRVRTPLGVTIDIDSPATGQLGESGIEGHVDNRWSERIGAAMLLSFIDDSVKLAIQQQSNDRQGDTIVLPSTTANSSKLAEKVLDSTINIPPLIYQNQGGIVGIYVARDVDFSSVYALVPTTEGPARP